jgi:hypothetical protein
MGKLVSKMSAPTGTQVTDMATARRHWTPLLAIQLAMVLGVLGAGVTSAALMPAGQVARHSDAVSRTLVAQAASRVTTVGSFRMTLSIKISITGGHSLTTNGTGLVDTIRKVQSGQLELPGLGTMRYRQIGSTGYIGLPGGRTDGLGHHWIGLTGFSSSSVGAQDPLAMLRMLGGSSKIRDRGEEKVVGVRTTHYSVDIDVAQLLAAAQQSGNPLPPGAASQLGDSHVDVWLDNQNLPRRLRLSLKSQAVGMRMQFEFADYGGRVDVQAPAASDVTVFTTTQQALLAFQSFGRSVR